MNDLELFKWWIILAICACICATFCYIAQLKQQTKRNQEAIYTEIRAVSVDGDTIFHERRFLGVSGGFEFVKNNVKYTVNSGLVNNE